MYAGIERQVDSDTAESIKLITRKASERICRFAFDYAVKNNRKEVCVVTKANIMKLSDGLFLDSYRKVAEDYPDIQKKEVLKLVQSILSVQQEKDYKTEFLLDSFQYYFAQLMKNNLDNKLLVNKLKKDILSIQKAKKELNSYIKPQLILENLMFGLC